MYSWLTSDDKTSIQNVASGRKMRTVYLLQPNSKQSIPEEQYDGFGMFDSVDAHEWLANENIGVEDRE